MDIRKKVDDVIASAIAVLMILIIVPVVYSIYTNVNNMVKGHLRERIKAYEEKIALTKDKKTRAALKGWKTRVEAQLVKSG